MKTILGLLVMTITSLVMLIYVVHGIFWGTMISEIISNDITQFIISIELSAFSNIVSQFVDKDGSSFYGLIGGIIFILFNLVALYLVVYLTGFFFLILSFTLFLWHPKLFEVYEKFANWYVGYGYRSWENVEKEREEIGY